MWRIAQHNLTLPATARNRPSATRAGDRRRLRLVGGLRSVARRANVRGVARRYELLLCERAASVRPQLLELAAALERTPDPGPDTLDAVHSLLTDGCTSPLYNGDVPAADLSAALDRIQAGLDARDPGPQDLSPLPLRRALSRAPGTRST